jgi:hypothetical protein
MTAVEVTIAEPADGMVVVGGSPVALVGRVGLLPPALSSVPLYYRWYSSEFPAQEGHYSLNEDPVLDPIVAYPANLSAGSQAITLAVGDQRGQDANAQNTTRNGGVGGGAKGPTACVVHVLRAVVRAPAPGASVSKAAATLQADGPVHWSEPDYQAMNRLRYSWRFDPDPADGRKAADLVPSASALVAETSGGVTVLRYSGPLPDLDLGGYTMRLRVEDIDDPTVADVAAVAVVIAP